MKRRSMVLMLAGAAFGVTAPSAKARAQEWNDARTRALVEQATQRRALQIADTALAGYHAAAHGYLTFLAQVGEGFTEPPKIVKADELALEVYWRAPNLSKQLISGRRDTLLLPTDINYHRDHLGIIQNNFPGIIRLGDGDEVRDVPHPLSADGLNDYDYAIRDSLRIGLGPRTLEVYEVRVRPRDDRQPRAVGAVYIDKESGEVVRMAFSFTRAALKDKELEDVSVVLENGLIEGRFWLPRRQEIEIRRTGTWLDYPARGIIRGRWEICCYEVNTPLPPGIFSGPEIALAPRGTKPTIPFTGRVLDSLPPDVRAVTDADVAKVQEEARALVRGQALARTRSTALSARSVSDFVRVNRVEGIAIGSGITRRLGDGFAITGRGRYGFDDKEAKGRAEFSYRRASGAGIRVFAYHDYAMAGDVNERSLTLNSIASQEFGSDYTDLYHSNGGSLQFQLAPAAGWTTSLEGAIELQHGAEVHATPASGRYEATLNANNIRQQRLTLALDRPTMLGPLGFEIKARAEASFIRFRKQPVTDFSSLGRLSFRANFERPVGRQRFVAQTIAASADIGDAFPPVQDLVFLGGPVSGPGYDFHQFVSETGFSQRLEFQTPAPFFSIPLGRYGKTPSSMTIAPFFNALWVAKTYVVRDPAVHGASGWHPSIGVGALSLFDLLRMDVARGLQDGRWTFSVDVTKDLWRVL
ncbi:MAG: hypothetical protein ABJC63_02405 [Gemmatimonadales bacterium]